MLPVEVGDVDRWHVWSLVLSMRKALPIRREYTARMAGEQHGAPWKLPGLRQPAAGPAQFCRWQRARGRQFATQRDSGPLARRLLQRVSARRHVSLS
jgi:hypothetical protein